MIIAAIIIIITTAIIIMITAAIILLIATDHRHHNLPTPCGSRRVRTRLRTPPLYYVLNPPLYLFLGMQRLRKTSSLFTILGKRFSM